jgi:hypothetical protein
MSKRKTAPRRSDGSAGSGGAQPVDPRPEAGRESGLTEPEPETTPPAESPAGRTASARTRRDRERANAIEAP